MVSLDALFESYSRFMASRGKYLLAVWALLIVLLSPYAATLSHIVSYSINVPSSDAESQTAQQLIQTQFRGYSPSNSTAYLVLEGPNVLDPAFYREFESLNHTLYSRLNGSLSNITSVYGFEYKLLLVFLQNAADALNGTEDAVNTTSHDLHVFAGNLSAQDQAIHGLAHNLSTLASSMWSLSAVVVNLSSAAHTLELNLTRLNSAAYGLQANVSQVVDQVDKLVSQIYSTNKQVYALRSQVYLGAQLIYGVPQLYVDLWLQQASASNYTAPVYALNAEANATLFSIEGGFSGDPEAKAYYQFFYAAWTNLTDSDTASAVASHAYVVADEAVGAALPKFISAAGMGGQQATFLVYLASYFNITDFEDPLLINEFTLQYATMGLSAQQAAFVVACFALGEDPSPQAVDSLALRYATMGLSAQQAAFVVEAFYGVQKQGLRGFVLSYLEHQINQTSPTLAQTVERELNVSLAVLLNYAYNLSDPVNQTRLSEYTVRILSNALPANLKATLTQQFNLTAESFVEGVVGLGYPPGNTSVEAYVVHLFASKVKLSVDTNETTQALLNQVYSLGPAPTNSSSISLAVNLSLQSLPEDSKNNISEYFGVTPNAYLYMVASLGYPPNQGALENLSLTLFSQYLEHTNTTLVHIIQANYNITVTRFLSQVYGSQSGLGLGQLQSLSVGYTYRLIEHGVSGQPFLTYNLTSVNSTLSVLLGNHNYAELVGTMLNQSHFGSLPVTPTRGLLYEFVDPSLNTTVVTLNFKSAPPNSVLTSFEDVASAYNTTGFRVYYTSSQIISNGLRAIVSKSQLYAIPFGLAASVIITGVFFGSPVAALIPILVFGVGATVGFGLIHLYLGYYEHTTLSYISPIIILILSLGLVTDYTVLILNRFRQELGRGKRPALAVSTRWAGEAVFTSGVTVILSYVVLSAAHIPLFSDVGAANALIVVSILAASLTFLPGLLSLLGGRAFWPKTNFSYKPSVLSKATRRALKHPRSVLATLLVLTVVAAAVASSLPVNIDFLALTPAGPGKTGLDQITHNYGGSTLVPTYVVVTLPAKLSLANNVFNLTELGELANLTGTIRGAQGVVAVYGPVTPYNYTIPYAEVDGYSPTVRQQYASGILNYVSLDNTSVYFKVVFAGDPFGNSVLRDAVQLRQTLHRVVPAGYTVYVGGSSLDSQAALSYVFDVLPKIVVLLVFAIYVVLLLQLKSAFTPLRLIATILSSIAWTLFLGWIIFYRIGNTSVFVFAPLFLVTTMLGVGVDYDIFMMTRVREEARKGLSDEEAIMRTSETTAGVVTTLGLILSSVFFGLTLTQIKLVQQIGLSLALGILLDTFVVWLLYVPSIMVLAKRLNWWPSDPRREAANGDGHK